MAAGYSKEFLVEAFVSRFYILGKADEEAARKMATEFYDKVGKDKFRVYCSLDAEALQKYRLEHC